MTRAPVAPREEVRVRPTTTVVARPIGFDRVLDVAPWLLPWAALLLAWAALRGADVEPMTDLGLASILPAGYFVALAVAAASFVLALRRRERQALLVLQMVAAVVLLYGVTVVLEDVPSFSVVYRHAGIIDHFLRDAPLDPSIDAYFNWPGFFLLVEVVVDLAGLESILPIASYAPMAFNLLALPALVVIAKAAVSDWRTAWIGVWFFYLTNWVGQDYLSPQAYAFVLHLTIAVGVLTALFGRIAGSQSAWRRRLAAGVRRLGAGRAGRTLLAEDSAAARATVLERAGVVVACTLALAAMVASHQLTPFGTLLMLVVLVIARRTTARLLPVIGALLLAWWLTFMAVDYLGGNGRELLAEAVSFGSNVSANVGERVNGSDEHLVIVYVRIAVTAALWLLAAVGVARIVRRGRPVPGHALLAFVPLVLVLLQPYGGEALLRAYLYGLPFITVLVAWALFPATRTWSWQRSVALLLVSCSLMGALMLTRYGNERASMFTTGERAAVTFVYDQASPGDVIAAASPNVPWQDRGYDDFQYELVSRLVDPAVRPTESPLRLADRVVTGLQAAAGDGEAYLVITRSQLAYDEMLGSQPWGSVSDLREGALLTDRMRLVYRNTDGLVFRVEEAS